MWFVEGNINDDEVLANFPKCSSMWINVGLQYSTSNGMKVIIRFYVTGNFTEILSSPH
jgi:hypothetical protein